ncbi:MAG: baseplate J/gp47 family protein [Thermodesulfovibrionales bacterium]|nr:baseplate J/gp47 family protein [Thermodesulfovibrionales bacterium]
MSFIKDFNELFNAILTDYKNQFPEADTSQASLLYIKSACLASALWGLYKHQEWVGLQIFPDTADSEYMEHHAWLRGVSRKAGETDEELLARLLEYLRRPPAGGNKSDYEKWALEITNVAGAYCFPLAQGLGTVDVLIIADEDATGSEVPSSFADETGANTSVSAGKLVDSTATFVSLGVKKGDVVKNDTAGTEATVTAVDSETQLTLSADIFTATPQNYTVKSLTVKVKEYIDIVRPVTVKDLRVLGPTVLTQNVSIVTGSDADKAQTASDIEAYLKSLAPEQVLYRSQLIKLALENGADNATVSTPGTDVVPGTYEMLRPGVISVS